MWDILQNLKLAEMLSRKENLLWMVSPGPHLVSTRLWLFFLDRNFTDSSQNLTLMVDPGFSPLLFANQRCLGSVKE